MHAYIALSVSQLHKKRHLGAKKCFNLLELFLVLAVHPDEIVPKSSFNLKIQGQFPVVNEGSRNTSCCLVVFGVVTTLEPESTVIIPHSKITFNA